MRRFQVFIIYLICFLLQSTVLVHVSVFGASPDLILALTIVFCFFFENSDGVIMGVLFGVVQDICFSPVVGISALLYMIIGLALQMSRIGVYRDNKVVLLILTAICTVFYYAGTYVLYLGLLSWKWDILFILKPLPAALIWNYIAVLLACRFARKRKGFTV